ncbi:TIGR02452 family protein [Candidatus Cytomitobacter indipagum]|nr:TIGR02452 family protein [Candidatus Cytomitobacter indipagum]
MKILNIIPLLLTSYLNCINLKQDRIDYNALHSNSIKMQDIGVSIHSLELLKLNSRLANELGDLIKDNAQSVNFTIKSLHEKTKRGEINGSDYYAIITALLTQVAKSTYRGLSDKQEQIIKEAINKNRSIEDLLNHMHSSQSKTAQHFKETDKFSEDNLAREQVLAIEKCIGVEFKIINIEGYAVITEKYDFYNNVSKNAEPSGFGASQPRKTVEIVEAGGKGGKGLESAGGKGASTSGGRGSAVTAGRGSAVTAGRGSSVIQQESYSKGSKGLESAGGKGASTSTSVEKDERGSSLMIEPEYAKDRSGSALIADVIVSKTGESWSAYKPGSTRGDYELTIFANQHHDWNVDNETSLNAKKAANSTYKNNSTELNKRFNEKLKSKTTHVTKIEVANTDSITASDSAIQQGLKVAVLDFANKEDMCGGFKKGASAQEEDLCRSTNLFHILQSRIKQHSSLYPIAHNEIIYAPGVSLIRKAKKDDYKPFDKIHNIAVVVQAAYCINDKLSKGASNKKFDQYAFNLSKGNVEEFKNITKAKMRDQLKAAYITGSDTFITGAWGCGVFGNSPEFITQCYKEVLSEKEFQGLFKKVIFAIPGKGGNNTIFNKAFDMSYNSYDY